MNHLQLPSILFIRKYKVLFELKFFIVIGYNNNKKLLRPLFIFIDVVLESHIYIYYNLKARAILLKWKTNGLSYRIESARSRSGCVENRSHTTIDAKGWGPNKYPKMVVASWAKSEPRLIADPINIYHRL